MRLSYDIWVITESLYRDIIVIAGHVSCILSLFCDFHCAVVLIVPLLSFSCEDLQDTDLELGLNNSAFYDQFAIAQVVYYLIYSITQTVQQKSLNLSYLCLLSPSVWPVGCLAHLAGHLSDGVPQGLPQLQTRGPARQPDPREGLAARPLGAPQLRPQDRHDLERKARGCADTHIVIHTKLCIVLHLPQETPMCPLCRQSKSIGLCSHWPWTEWNSRF